MSDWDDPDFDDVDDFDEDLPDDRFAKIDWLFRNAGSLQLAPMEAFMLVALIRRSDPRGICAAAPTEVAVDLHCRVATVRNLRIQLENKGWLCRCAAPALHLTLDKVCRMG